MEFEKLKLLLEAKGYRNIRVKHWKKHDTLCLTDKVGNKIKITLTSRVEQVPVCSWAMLFRLEGLEEGIRLRGEDEVPKDEAKRAVKDYILAHPGSLTSDITLALKLEPLYVVNLLKELAREGVPLHRDSREGGGVE